LLRTCYELNPIFALVFHENLLTAKFSYDSNKAGTKLPIFD